MINSSQKQWNVSNSDKTDNSMKIIIVFYIPIVHRYFEYSMQFKFFLSKNLK